MYGEVMTGLGPLENEALLLLPLPGGERGTSGVLKDLPDTFVGLGRALDVLLGSDLILDLSRLHRPLARLVCKWRTTHALRGIGEGGHAPAPR